MTSHSAFFGIAKAAALEAGDFLASRFAGARQGVFKSSHDIGLPEDKLSEEIILSRIRKHFPEHAIFSEEAGRNAADSEYCWYVDPLDGTNNYFAKLPYFSVSIALLRRNEIILGVVYNPISRQFFYASKGAGAFLNDQPIVPSTVTDLAKAVCAFERGYRGDGSDESAPAVLSALEGKFRRCLVMWAPALDWCLLACGGIDALVSIDSSLEDQVAGTLIAQEAGCLVQGTHNSSYLFPQLRIIATNTYLQPAVQAIVSPLC